MKPVTEIYTVGQEFELEMLPPTKGPLPICRTDHGVVALIRIVPGTGRIRYEVGSIWNCRVYEVKEKCILITPVTEIMTAEQNAELAAEKAKTAFMKLPQHREKNRRSFPYMSKIEQLQASR